MRMHVPVAAHVFLLREESVLLLRRFNTGYEDGSFSVPAGHLDGGETVREAASRETEEETGLRIAPGNFEVVAVMHRKAAAERIDFFLVARHWSGEPVNREPGRCDLLDWFPLASLPGKVIPYVRHALERYRSGEWFLEHGWPA